MVQSHQMIVQAYKTPKITPGTELFHVFDSYLPTLQENCIVVVTSKIVSICQGDIIKNDGSITKKELTQQEAEYYLGEEYELSHGYTISINHSTFTASAGIDESNGNGYFILWPKNIQDITNKIWDYLRKKNMVQNLGVIITDSHVNPLRFGVTGFGITWCGFHPIKNYVGQPDIFNHLLKVTRSSHLDGIAAAAVVVMGEGNEQTPLAIVSNIPFVSFQDREPSIEELEAVKISIDQDVYAPILKPIKWKKGKRNNE